MRTPALIATLAALLTATHPALAERVEIRPDAPDRHVVVKGDTLWGISAKFLESPWRWPEVWRMNKDTIRNPHLIYPGDVILLSHDADGQPRLTRIETVRVSPQVRAEPIERKDAIPTLPYAAIAPFLVHTTLVDEADLLHKPRVLGGRDTRTLLTPGDIVYASATDGATESWDVVRPGRALRAPATGELLAQEAEYVGRARVVEHGSPATLRITEAVGEIRIGDRLQPSSENTPLHFVQHAPEDPVEARIISAYGSVIDSIGQFATVVIDKGRAHGLREGGVLAVYRPGRVIDVSAHEPTVQLPDDRVALIMVYRAFDRVSYALVMQADGPVRLLDSARNP